MDPGIVILLEPSITQKTITGILYFRPNRVNSIYHNLNEDEGPTPSPISVLQYTIGVQSCEVWSHFLNEE